MALNPLPNGTRLRPTSLAPQGRFVVLDAIGAGGFGRTYRAHDLHERLGGSWRSVVIKEFGINELCERRASTLDVVLVPHHDSNFNERHAQILASWRARFLNEARHLFALHSPYIPAVYDLWDGENNTAYYAMEDAGNNVLVGPEHDDDFVPLPWSRLRPLALDLLAALHDVHSAGIAVHGDIKPSNIMVAPDGGLRLIDFGTARTGAEVRKTVTSRAYTRGYAAPELQGTINEEPGPWSDLYGWAMVVLSLANAQPTRDRLPQDASTRLAVADSGGIDVYDAIDTHPAALEQIGERAWLEAIARCVRLQPRDRPERAYDLLNVLTHAPAAPARPPRPAPVATPAPRSAAPLGTPPSTSPRAGTIVEQPKQARDRTVTDPVPSRTSGPGNQHATPPATTSPPSPVAKKHIPISSVLAVAAAGIALFVAALFALPSGRDEQPVAESPNSVNSPTPPEVDPTTSSASVGTDAGSVEPVLVEAPSAEGDGRSVDVAAQPTVVALDGAPASDGSQTDSMIPPHIRLAFPSEPAEDPGDAVPAERSSEAAPDEPPYPQEAGTQRPALTRPATPQVSTPSPRCGDRRCNGNETCSSCASDCGCRSGEECSRNRCVRTPTCGDGTCNGRETCGTCARDCGCSSGELCQNGACVSQAECRTRCEDLPSGSAFQRCWAACSGQ